MKAEVLRPYYDKVQEKYKYPGEVIDVKQERLSTLLDAKVAKQVTETKKEPKK